MYWIVVMMPCNKYVIFVFRRKLPAGILLYQAWKQAINRNDLTILFNISTTTTSATSNPNSVEYAHTHLMQDTVETIIRKIQRGLFSDQLCVRIEYSLHYGSVDSGRQLTGNHVNRGNKWRVWK